jgi:hypothetical protein
MSLKQTRWDQFEIGVFSPGRNQHVQAVKCEMDLVSMKQRLTREHHSSFVRGSGPDEQVSEQVLVTIMFGVLSW